jgi:hypothetical protein
MKKSDFHLITPNQNEDKALSYINQAEENYKKNPNDISKEVWDLLYEAFRLNLESTKEYCKTTLINNPQHLLALGMRAEIFFNQNQLDSALQDYNTLLKILPKHSIYYKHFERERKNVDILTTKNDNPSIQPNFFSPLSSEKNKPMSPTSRSPWKKNSIGKVKQPDANFSKDDKLEKEPISLLPKRTKLNFDEINKSCLSIQPLIYVSSEFIKDIAEEKEKKSKLSLKEKQAIGKWGETQVFQSLKNKYESIYNNSEKFDRFSSKEENVYYEDKEIKLIEAQYKIVCYTKESNPQRIEWTLCWFNKGDESGKSYDLKIIEQKGIQELVKQVIEVKTTLSEIKAKATFTQNELKKMQKYQSRYQLFRVYGAPRMDGKGSPKARIETLENPYAKLFPASQNLLFRHEPPLSVIRELSVKI